MVSDKVNFDFGADIEDSNYKSYFARSMAVSSSQYKESKSLDFRHVQLQCADNSMEFTKGLYSNHRTLAKQMELPEGVKLRKDLHTEDTNRLSYSSSNSSRRASLCSNRMLENPVENYLLQTQLDTLQWQLKETESSREMYRAVMRQVVTFLERAHRSLELLGSRINTRVPRTQSEYHMNSTLANGSFNDTTITANQQHNESDLGSYREFTWRRPKKAEPTPEEIPPDKLSQEAFRLLRTAQSLLSTHEPDLAHISNSEEDLHFLTQLAKEFPPTPEIKPIRTTSFSMSPKLLTPEKDLRISTAFNRKLSLQLNDNLRRNSFLKDVSNKLNRSNESSRSSIAESDLVILEDRSIKSTKLKYEKSNSPPVSSVGSAEDESGFSSMNSFQEVGLPHSHMIQLEDPKEALLKSMLHTNEYTNQNCHNDFFDKPALDDIKLWETTTNSIHKRWRSSPVDNLSNDKAAIKVLWV